MYLKKINIMWIIYNNFVNKLNRKIKYTFLYISKNKRIKNKPRNVKIKIIDLKIEYIH